MLGTIIQNEHVLYTTVAVEIWKSCFEIYSSFPSRTWSYFKLILLPLSVHLCIFMGSCLSRAIPSPFTATFHLTELIMLYAQLSPAVNKTEPGILFFIWCVFMQTVSNQISLLDQCLSNPKHPSEIQCLTYKSINLCLDFLNRNVFLCAVK